MDDGNLEVGTPVELAARFAARVASIAREAVAARGRFTVAITGGSLADAFLPALATVPMPWPVTDVFWTDERCVPPDAPDSNYGQARRLLFGSGLAATARLHRILAERPEAEATAGAEAALIEVAGPLGRLDLILLGVGEDGHVCSLFPGHAAVAEAVRLMVAIADSPKPPLRRITMTMRVLAAADQLWVGAFGAGKAEVIRAARMDPTDQRPVAQAARGHRRVTWWLDQATASR